MRRPLPTESLRNRLKALVVLLAILQAVTGRALTNNLALTPPMGWNSWNAFGCSVSDALIRSVADTMKTNGMLAAGYQFVNMDDCWQCSRDSNGVIVPSTSFPYGIQALAAYVHSDGLKLGLYSDHGYTTCQQKPGSYGYEYLDANTYASWGVDYLKYDNCWLPPNDNEEADYARMSEALMTSGQPITFSVCAWTFWSWEPGLGNLWRTTSDISDSYTSMISNIDPNSPPAFVAGPGRWNDPDMLEVGNGGMTTVEDQTHFTMWCIMAAPLIAGNNLSAMSAATLAILTNAEAIAVDQDPAGEQGVKVVNNVSPASTNEVWSKTLGYDFSTKAVVLFNRNGPATNITCNWTNIGLQPGAASVRDLWTHTNYGLFTNSFTTNVPSHAAVLLKIVGTPPTIPASGADFHYLSDLQPVYAYVGWGTMTKDRSIGGNALTVGGVVYSKGLGVHAYSGVEYNLGGVASRFQAIIGVDDEVLACGVSSVDFQVYADGTLIYDSGVMFNSTPPQAVDLDVTGVSRLVLGVNDADDTITCDHADWANALVIVTNAAPAPPAAPGGLTASAGNSIELSWNAVRSATAYNVKRSTNGGGPFATVGSPLVSPYSDGNVVLGTTYYYVVSATDCYGESANSAEVAATACPLPVPPANVAAVVTVSNVTLSWSPVPGATSYSVARALSGTPCALIGQSLTGTNFIDTNAAAGAVNYYVVTAANSCNEGPPSALAAAIVPSPNSYSYAYTNSNCAVCAPSGLISWWPGESNADDVAGANNGTAEDGVAYVPGEVGSAFAFDGVVARIDFGNQIGNFETNDFTIECWLKTSTTAPYSVVLAKRNCPAHGSLWDINITRGLLYLELDQDASADNYLVLQAGSNPINDGRFHHVAATRRAGLTLVYVDGVLAASGAAAGITAISNNADFFAGAESIPGDPSAVENAWAGILDDIRIYNRALASSEIQAIYQAGSNGMCAPAPFAFCGNPVWNITNGVILNATLRSGQNYGLQVNTNLASTNWVTLTNFMAGTAPVFQYTNALATNVPAQFYRLVAP